MPIPGTWDDPKKKLTDDPGALPQVGTSNPACVISGVTITGSGSTGTHNPGDFKDRDFIFVWATSVPSSSLVRCGLNGLDQISPEQDTNPLVTNHSVTLRVHWQHDVMLNYQVQSRLGGGTDGMGNAVMDGYVFTQGGTFNPIPTT